jgi:hypothetical protein
MSEQRVSSLLSDEPEQSSLHFENIEKQYEELAKVMEGSMRQEELLMEDIPVKEEEPLIKHEEPLIDLKPEVEEEKVEEPVAEAQPEQEQEPELTDEEKLKFSYMKEMQSLNLSDNNVIANLEYMMNMGYLNFRVNYNLLMRNNNDLVIAINKLCNNMVSESIFLAE